MTSICSTFGLGCFACEVQFYNQVKFGSIIQCHLNPPNALTASSFFFPDRVNHNVAQIFAASNLHLYRRAAPNAGVQYRSLISSRSASHRHTRACR